jgi:hypothetical protein
MRKYLIHTILGILLLTIVGMQLVMSPIVGQPIGVSLEIKPGTLNLKEKGIIIAVIEFLNSSYDVSDIDFESIRLRVEFALDWVEPIRCIVAGRKLIVRFDGLSVKAYILSKLVHMQIVSPQAKYPIDLVVEGIVEGEYFEGSDQIEIVLL